MKTTLKVEDNLEKQFTWNEMKEKPGLYTCAVGSKDATFYVNRIKQVFFFASDVLEIASEGAWSHQKFVRVNSKVTFTVET